MNIVRFNGRELSPSKIVCVGRNYVDHAKELGNEVPENMVLFFKPNSSISHKLISFLGEQLHYELEIALLVEQGGYVGIGLGVDLTKRELQSVLKKSGLPWEKAKAFNQSAVFSEFIRIPTELEHLEYTLLIDGDLRQHGRVSNMLFKPEAILSECNEFVSLQDGDIIMTGTPKGVGEIKKGAYFKAQLFNGSIESGDVLLTAEWQAQ